LCPWGAKEPEIWNFWNFRAQTQNIAFGEKIQNVKYPLKLMPYFPDLPNMMDSQKLPLPSDVTQLA
jgi:hypothetical protein